MQPWNISRLLKTFLLFLCAAPTVLSAQNFQTILSFHNQASPEGMFATGFPGPTQLVQGKDGYLYGTTSNGGTNSVSGTVFKVKPDGTKFTTLHVFSPSGVQGDGQYPQSGLLLDTNGSFYGTTQQGGSSGAVGTAYRVGSSLPLHSFTNVNNEGLEPDGGLFQGTDGELYGTTTTGGANNCGTIFKMTVAGPVKKLYDFPMVPGGCGGPLGNLIQAADGSFYGTMWQGPTNNDTPGWIYKITSAAKLTVVHNFQGPPNDGGFPGAGLLQASDGKFYGTTCYGGNAPNFGTVFRMDSSGNVTVLVNFGTVGAPGQCPRAPLIQASDGNFYGTTTTGGNNTCSASTLCGTIFQVTPSGQYSTLHLFDYSTNKGPWFAAGGLIQDTDGSFYGLTSSGATAPQPMDATRVAARSTA
jgi:uncharacterized repeat protein (TIGR03803 family)